jgi:hypothetical protein
MENMIYGLSDTWFRVLYSVVVVVYILMFYLIYNMISKVKHKKKSIKN